MQTCSEEEVANVYIGDSNATPLHQRQRQCCKSGRKCTDSKCRLPKSQSLDGKRRLTDIVDVRGFQAVLSRSPEPQSDPT